MKKLLTVLAVLALVAALCAGCSNVNSQGQGEAGDYINSNQNAATVKN